MSGRTMGTTEPRVCRRRWRSAALALAAYISAAPASAETGDGAEPFLTLNGGRVVWHADASPGEPPPIVRVVRHAMREAGDRDVRDSEAALRILSRHGLSRGWALLRMGERALAAGDSARADSCWALASAVRQAFQWPAARARHDLLLARRGPPAALAALVDPPCCGDAHRTANLLRARTMTAAGDSVAALAGLAQRPIPVDSIESAVGWLERVYGAGGPAVRAATVPPAARLWAQRAARIGMRDWIVDGLEGVRDPRARFAATIDAANGLRGVRSHTRGRALLGALISPASPGDSAQHRLDLAEVQFTLARIERAADRNDAADAAYGEAIRLLEGSVPSRPPVAAARAELRAEAVRHRADLALARGRLTHARRVLDGSAVPGSVFQAGLLSVMLNESGEAARRFARVADEGGRYWTGHVLRASRRARADSLLGAVAGSPWFDFYPALARSALNVAPAPRAPAEALPRSSGPAALRTAELLFHLGLRDAALVPLELSNEIRDGADPAAPGEYIGMDGRGWLRAARIAYQAGDVPLGIRLAHKARYRAKGPDAAFDPAGAAAWLYPPAYDSLYAAAGAAHGVDPWLLSAIGWQESFFDARAVSRAGALGVMQFMPATARSVARALGEDPPGEADLLTASTSIRLGGRYVADLLRRFGGAEPPALAAYNAGPGRADAWIRRANGDTGALFCEVIGFDETINYVKNIVGAAEAYRTLRPRWARGAVR